MKHIWRCENWGTWEGDPDENTHTFIEVEGPETEYVAEAIAKIVAERGCVRGSGLLWGQR